MMVIFHYSFFVACLLSALFSTATAGKYLPWRRQIPSANDYISGFSFPSCVAVPAADDFTCDYNSAFSQCQSKQCTMTFFGACMQWGMMTDRRCMCNSMNYGMCLHSCHPDWHRTRYLRWLNESCGTLESWTGLPSDWTSQLVDGIGVKNITDRKSPDCMKTSSCSANPSTIASRCVQAADVPGDSEAPSVFGYGSLAYGKIDQKCYCDQVGYSAGCGLKGCSSDTDRTEYFLWLNATCGNLTGWSDIPNNWTQQLALYTPPRHVFTNSSSSWPKCITGKSECGRNLASAWVKYNSSVGNVGWNGFGAVAVVDRYKFCDGVRYEGPCHQSCKLHWQRADHLRWLNSTCAAAPSWRGLPADWDNLLSIQYDDLFPWTWRVSPAPGNNGTAQRHCPTAAAKLGAFAAVNVAMALLVPIVGRRTVVYTITFGLFGKPDSRMWPLTALISVTLHLTSNAVSALLVKRTEGFANLSIGALTLIWCTRPRLAWLAVALLPYQAEDAMYFQVAASAVVAEMALQLIGSVYMGLTAHHGQLSKFYRINGLRGAPSEHSAIVMYVGALLWLVVIYFTVVACAYSALGINRIIGSVADRIGTSRKLRRVSKALGRARLERQRVWETIQAPAIDKDSLMNEWQTLITEWQNLEEALQGQGAKDAAYEKARVAREFQRALQRYRDTIDAMRRAQRSEVNPPAPTWQYSLMKMTGRGDIGSQATWHEPRNSWSLATAHWGILQAAWTKILKAKESALTPEQQRSATLRDIRLSVILGMLGTWTAQWLFWAGYVTLAADSYCPPKLALIATIWTLFSIAGVGVGASV